MKRNKLKGPGAVRATVREARDRTLRNQLYASTPVEASESRQVRNRKAHLSQQKLVFRKKTARPLLQEPGRLGGKGTISRRIIKTIVDKDGGERRYHATKGWRHYRA